MTTTTGAFSFDRKTKELVLKLDNIDEHGTCQHRQGLDVMVRQDQAECCQFDADGNPIEGFARLWLVFNKDGLLTRAYEL